MDRRPLLQLMTAGAVGASLKSLSPAYARADTTNAALPARQVTGESVIDLTIDNFPLRVNGRTGKAVAVNGTVQKPVIQLPEGQDAVLRVTNRLKKITSSHWHGVLLPAAVDGPPVYSARRRQPNAIPPRRGRAGVVLAGPPPRPQWKRSKL
jgi:FtsP/CotA-like multicopper oxidase with cupredoxin domain